MTFLQLQKTIPVHLQEGQIDHIPFRYNLGSCSLLQIK